MAHVDKFGRAWHFKPGHDTDCMLYVPTDVMARFIHADRILRGGSLAPAFGGVERLECYVLKMESQTYTGARYGDEQHEYLSSLIHDSFVVRKLLEYARNYGAWSMENMCALCEIF